MAIGSDPPTEHVDPRSVSVRAARFRPMAAPEGEGCAYALALLGIGFTGFLLFGLTLATLSRNPGEGPHPAAAFVAALLPILGLVFAIRRPMRSRLPAGTNFLLITLPTQAIFCAWALRGGLSGDPWIRWPEPLCCAVPIAFSAALELGHRDRLPRLRSFLSGVGVFLTCTTWVLLAPFQLVALLTVPFAFLFGFGVLLLAPSLALFALFRMWRRRSESPHAFDREAGLAGAVAALVLLVADFLWNVRDLGSMPLARLFD